MKQLTITSEAAARLLTDTEAVRRLEPFMRRDMTLSEAAQTLGLKLPSLLYHVNKFVRLGLLEVVRELPRGGRAVKVYRSTSEGFFIPFQITPSETLERLLYDLSTPQEQTFHREAARVLQAQSPVWGLTINGGAEGVTIHLTPHADGRANSLEGAFFAPDAEALFASDGTLTLDFQTAKALQRDMFELYARYRGLQKDKGRTYAYRLGLTPVRDES